MLRTLFVLALACTGVAYAFQGPLYGLLFYLWVAYFRPEQWVWDGSIVSVMYLSTVAMVFTLAGTILWRTQWRINLRIALLGLFLLHTLLSTIFAVQTDYAWPYWFEFFKAVVISYFIVVLSDDIDNFRLVLLVIALSLGAEATKQGWIELIRHPGSRNDNPFPMLGDNNGVAVGMLMLVPTLTSLAATATTKWERAAHRFMAFGVLYRAICTYSRGGFLACAALGSVYVLRGQKRLMTAVIIVVAAAVVTPVLPAEFWDRMSTITTPDQVREDDTSALGRLHFWNVAIAMANASPVFGVGHNSFNVIYDSYDDTDGAFGRGRSVHSSWFGLLAELGYPGLLLFIAQLVLAFLACSRARRAARVSAKHANLAVFAFGIEAAMVVFIVGGTFLPFQYTEMLWHFIGLSIALDMLARAALASVARVPGTSFDDAPDQQVAAVA
jgi:probable O-glycosylation ligase (exosortase A-associated)